MDFLGIISSPDPPPDGTDRPPDSKTSKNMKDNAIDIYDDFNNANNEDEFFAMTTGTPKDTSKGKTINDKANSDEADATTHLDEIEDPLYKNRRSVFL